MKSLLLWYQTYWNQAVSIPICSYISLMKRFENKLEVTSNESLEDEDQTNGISFHGTLLTSSPLTNIETEVFFGRNCRHWLQNHFDKLRYNQLGKFRQNVSICVSVTQPMKSVLLVKVDFPHILQGYMHACSSASEAALWMSLNAWHEYMIINDHNKI